MMSDHDDSNEASEHKLTDEPTPSSAETEDESLDDLLDEDYLDVGFMFEGSHPTTVHTFRQWTPKIQPICIRCIDQEPGAVQSGHYVWPAASYLVDFCVANCEDWPIASLIELGAGCALTSLALLQLWQRYLQCVIVTDHDPGTLARARDNYETTLAAIVNSSLTEDELNSAINDIASIPVCFEPLEWGNANTDIAGLLVVHTNELLPQCDLVIGSDVIYSHDVVLPLFQSAASLLKPDGGKFLLSQSFSYDDDTEAAIEDACRELGFKRTILQEEKELRIQEFSYVPNSENHEAS